MVLVMPNKFQVIGYNVDEGARIKRKPVLRMSDAYLTTNHKVFNTIYYLMIAVH